MRRKAALFDLLDHPILVFHISFEIVIVGYIGTRKRLKIEKKQIVLDGEIRLTSNFLELGIDILLADYLYFFVIVAMNMNTLKLKVFI